MGRDTGVQALHNVQCVPDVLCVFTHSAFYICFYIVTIGTEQPRVYVECWQMPIRPEDQNYLLSHTMTIKLYSKNYQLYLKTTNYNGNF